MSVSIFVINLERATHRREFISNQMKAHGLPFEFLPAVDGHALPPETLRRHTRLPADYLWSTPLTPSEVGCLLSHKKAWETVVAQGLAWALILEDDVMLSADFGRFMKSLQWLPPQADLVRIEASHFDAPVQVSRQSLPALNRELRQMFGTHDGCAAYLISKRACAYLLQQSADLCMPVDTFMFSELSPIYGKLTMMTLIPALAIQDVIRAKLQNEKAHIKSEIAAERATRKYIGKRKSWPKALMNAIRNARSSVISPLIKRGIKVDWR